ncbi:anaerobic benzoate catabolism transcriptional regulator [Clostridium puniceum]|uniref:Anaerobic benzoate catabolism transcriptional regulator n=1 Tax=Clostridium puniceum TaxID=29367 RepID=A0A1S8TL24_9CLOT|nr:helix-turn-helix transcriptional regulator [Clostridium puniceum]OOM78135.1 anaerobic benzoate catabolism transcriptional regulator [Clostridium puniceum]
MNNEINILGINVKRFRKSNGISRKQLSIATQIDSLVLYEIECGDIENVSPNDLEKIARALDVSTLTLLGENVNVCEYINKLIYHIDYELKINNDSLTDDQKHMITTSLQSIINSIKYPEHNS